jgi:urease accessory protein
MDDGRAAVILLPRGTTLTNGDVLASDTGEQVLIRAAAESLLEITANTPFQLLRLVYHLANRHVSAMLTTDAIYIESDPVLADMVVRLGGAVKLTEQPFEPEKGAYHGASTHTPSHSHHGAMAPGGDGYGHNHGGVDDIDRKMGNVGEELSRQAHDKS